MGKGGGQDALGMGNTDCNMGCDFFKCALQIPAGYITNHNTCSKISLTVIHCYKRSIELSPNSGHAKYLYMGQLTSGEEAVGYISKGIDIMEAAVKCRVSEACALLDQVTLEDISTAYCTLAEIYLTDSW